MKRFNTYMLILFGYLLLMLSFGIKDESFAISKCVETFQDSNLNLIEKSILNNQIISYLYKDPNNKYVGKIYDCDQNNLSINNLIKEGMLTSFNNKIDELIKLKYPKFISDVLIKDSESGQKEYLLRKNEMIIYFQDYDIKPALKEELSLKVNYNEIKDYLDFSLVLDENYENERGDNYTNAKKSVAITFDDSPNKQKTTAILNSLNDNHFHATFFIVGERAKYQKDLLISMKSFGNELGSHTYHHQNMGKMTDEEIVNDFQIMNDFYQSIFKENLHLVRPPYGVIKNNQTSLLNVSFILWSLDTNDWRRRNSNYIVNYVLDNIKDGDIILMHDSYASTVEAVDILLPILYSEGYQVMSVSELLNLKGITLENNTIYRNARK